MPAPEAVTAEEIRAGLDRAGYLTTPKVETVLRLALALQKPLLIEGPPGAGKTEIGRVLAEILGTELLRLQCYEGLDESRSLFEWNYQKQILRIQSAAHEHRVWNDVASDIFGREFLLERPLLRAITATRRTVLLIDEIDKADEEFEAFLLEVLSEYQVTVPELGTIRAKFRPAVVLTSNATRELSDALKRRCLYLYLDFPGVEIERRIIDRKVPDLDVALRAHVARFVDKLRKLDLERAPSIAETLDWARALLALGVRELDTASVRDTLSVLVKTERDQETVRTKASSLISTSRAPS